MTSITTAGVRGFFDDEARHGRRLLPDPTTASGLGTYVKYCRAALLMADAGITSVLDVGCSVGSVEVLFHRHYAERAPAVRVHGVDISREAVERASALKLPSATFQVYDGNTLPFESGTFDLALAIEVIEHVVDKAKFLSEVWRVLRPGGRVFLTTPNPQCWTLRAEQNLEAIARRCFGRPVPEKDAFITMADLSALLEKTGFLSAGGGSQRVWPRPYVALFGWGILPPLPPRLLASYQRMCVRTLKPELADGPIGSRLAWTTSAVWQKP
jgi:SAM-dependent methyltransferase